MFDAAGYACGCIDGEAAASVRITVFFIDSERRDIGLGINGPYFGWIGIGILEDIGCADGDFEFIGMIDGEFACDICEFEGPAAVSVCGCCEGCEAAVSWVCNGYADDGIGFCISGESCGCVD